MKCEKHGEQSTFCRFCDAETIERETAKQPPYPFCCHPEKCCATGRCERRVGGELHCCAD
jgi:hypothetical protein